MRTLLSKTLLLTCLLTLPATAAHSQLLVSGQVDVLARSRADERGLNRNFRGDSPFNELRVKLFAQHWVSERVGVFTEFLFDVEADPRLSGAYVVVNELGGIRWLALRAGLAPAVPGTFGLRSTYFNSNPLIGVPLVWQHRTTLDGSGLFTGEDLLRRRDSNVIGLPMLYDGCWNLQWELMGAHGALDYSLGVTNGSVSNPLGAPTADGLQALARVGWEPTLGVRVGASAVHGPYIGGPTRDPLILASSFPGSASDYAQTLFGYDVELARGRAQLISEGYVSIWEAPLVTDDPTARAGYVEVRYDPLPRWITAVRVGVMTFNEISATVGGAPVRSGWDDDVLRTEAALTYRWTRELQLRGGWQRTRFLTGGEDPQDLLALQLRAAF